MTLSSSQIYTRGDRESSLRNADSASRDILTKRRNSTGMSDLELTEVGIQNFALSGT
uniref:Uncharacterized protein n=2 Tax=Daucus carota subsp. sativus TaxID=79200 RepID=A0A164V0F7_DAUCS